MLSEFFFCDISYVTVVTNSLCYLYVDSFYALTFCGLFLCANSLWTLLTDEGSMFGSFASIKSGTHLCVFSHLDEYDCYFIFEFCHNLYTGRHVSALLAFMGTTYYLLPQQAHIASWTRCCSENFYPLSSFYEFLRPGVECKMYAAFCYVIFQTTNVSR